MRGCLFCWVLFPLVRGLHWVVMSLLHKGPKINFGNPIGARFKGVLRGR